MLDPRCRSSEAGFVLLPVLLILALLLGVAAMLTTSVTMDSGLNGAYNRATTGFYAAESGLNVGMDNFRNKFVLFQLPCSGTSSSCADFSPTTYSLGQRTVSYQLTDPGNNPTVALVPAGHLFAGLNSVQYTYLIDSQSLNNGAPEADVGAQFIIDNVPLFQFLAFYNNDLEILPGANMTMHGRIHTNSDLYLNSDLTLQDTTNFPTIPLVQITAKNSIHRGRKDTTACGGTVQVATTAPTPVLQTLACNGSTSSVIPTTTLATWNGSMIAGVKSINVPMPAILNQGGQYWVSADLRIALVLNGQGPHSIVALNADGTTNTCQTNNLTRLMSDAAFNTAKSQFQGTKPVFMTDVPLATPRAGCSCNSTAYPPNGCAVPSLNCYWGTPMPTFTPIPPGATSTPTTTATRTPNGPTRTPVPGTPTAGPASTPTFGSDHAFYNTDRVYTTNTAAATGDPAAIGSMFKDSDPRRGGFYNWREKKWIYLLNINLRDLAQWNIDNKTTYPCINGYPFFDPTSADPNNNDPTHTAKGGPVLYLTVMGPTSNTINNYGVRIFGSSPLPFPAPTNGDPTGVTVVSDQPFYIAGDYNVPGTIGTTAYPKQPAAFMGDSINVLSNNALLTISSGNSCTNDCQSTLTLASRPASGPASTTTINAAFIGGVDTTTAGNYNGGLENYPRFHETWTGQTLTYRGSFVSLGNPSHVNGQWCGTGGSSTATTVTGCNIYNPPTRGYDYDSDFNDVKKLPPMTPRFVYVQQIVFTENFK